MEVREFEDLLTRVNFPNTEFRLLRDGFGQPLLKITCLKGDNAYLTGNFEKVISREFLKSLDEKAAVGLIRYHLKTLVLTEMDEAFQVGDDRPYYPHGPWEKHKGTPRVPSKSFNIDEATYRYWQSNGMQSEPLNYAALRSAVGQAILISDSTAEATF